ncbi:DUF3017 domain-containing protein [Streptomyces sp. NPDC094447]|uniref:DUF3017 domain-containing protein n=1 Tax=Streptomyces sp. NPDC094447 TaxID=3366062 RepID=UPI00381A1F83
MTPGTPGASGTPDADAPRNGSAGAAGRAGGGGAVGNGSADAPAPPAPADGATEHGATEPGTAGASADDTAPGPAAVSGPVLSSAVWKRPAPILTTDTARPEGGGRAAPSDAPAPARQWPLLTVLGLAGIGLLVVGTDAFVHSYRIGTMLVGAALLVGAVLRRVMPSVGMLAVRSRFTDMITYGVMGGLIVLLALMVQPRPWLKIPFLEDILHLTVT